MTNESGYDDKTVLIHGEQVSNKNTVLQTQAETTEQTSATASSQDQTIQEQLGLTEKHSLTDSGTISDTRLSEDLNASEQTKILTPDSTGHSLNQEATQHTQDTNQMNTQQNTTPVVGWLVIIEGPGRGKSCNIYYGNNTIGRSPSQTIPLNYGDNAISSEEQAYIQYNYKKREFIFVPNLSKTNVVEVNEDNPVSAVPLNTYDIIRMGETKLLFVPLCGPDFDWTENDGQS